MVLRSRSRISSARRTRSSTSSCSAWMYRPESASARPEASARTSRGASSGGVHGASSGNEDVMSVWTSPGEMTKTGINPPGPAEGPPDPAFRARGAVAPAPAAPPPASPPPGGAPEERAPADLRGDRLDLRGRSGGDGDLHPGGGELARDARADPAP